MTCDKQIGKRKSDSKAVRQVVYCMSVMALCLCGCGPRMPADQAVAVAQAIIEKLDGPKAVFFKPATAGQTSVPYMLHVDMSANMRGFLDSEDSTFRKVVRELIQRKAGAIEVVSFGTPRGDSKPLGESLSISDLMDPKNYDRKDSDFAAVIGSFEKKKEATHLILTDGVPWNLETLADYGPIKCAVNAFIKQGGSVALLVFRSPYKGEYTSVSRAQRGGNALTWILDVDTGNKPGRPFILWAFLKEGESIDDLKSMLKLENLVPEYTHAMNGTEIAVIPRDNSSATAANCRSSGLDKPAMRKLMSYFPEDLKPFNLEAMVPGCTKKTKTNEGGYASLQFEIKPSETFLKDLQISTVEEKCAWLNANVAPHLQCWELAVQKNRKVAVTNEITLNLKNEEPSRFFVPELRQRLSRGAKSSAQLEQEKLLLQSQPIILRVNVLRPKVKGSLFAWVLTLDLKGYADNLIPATVTTSDDSTADNADRVFNLRPMMGTALKDTCVPGRALFLTEWR